MDPIALLKADHRKVEELFKKLEDTTERAVKTRTELFEKLRMELTVHALAEEAVLYPENKEIPSTRELGFEAVEEHHVVKILLDELSELSPDTEEWTAKLSVLKENVQHHVKEEEGEIFPKTKKALSAEELDEMGARLFEEKEKLLGHMPA
ncbi:MAG: hemerythrin [Fibrobacteria bacterium]|jgi:hemerythrin superfamily protein|nr:hemerythrin [Fibrobacteria bacterium]